MTLNVTAPWHKESFDRFLRERLPELLARRLPLAGYAVESAGPRAHAVVGSSTGRRYEVSGQYFCKLRVTLGGEKGEVSVEFSEVPQPDEEGLFVADGSLRVVIPIASEEALDAANISCVGEQLYDFVEARLGQAPPNLPWDEPLVRSWLPLDEWMREFFQFGTRWAEDDDASRPARGTAQPIDDLNWLSRKVHLRRIIIPEREKMFGPADFGRVCPYETPEGPNIGRILTVANGAAIRDGKLVVLDDRPEAALGLSALMAPFLEHNDANRQLMGVNMMRQWVPPREPEPALVQTGYEPDAPDFWCGRNLLTAFISWGPDTYEDAILLSESCAKRLDFPHPVEPGDKLSNRHGTKGVVSRILPDDAMPHLADGTPVELVFSFMGCHSRLNFGQIREAVMGRIARAEGAPALVPPFHAPSEAELRERLRKAGLPESGMETLTMGRNGKRLLRPSLVGWIYWGKTHHLVKNKIHCCIGDGRPQQVGLLEYFVLRDAGAFEIVAELYNTCAAAKPDAATLASRVASGAIRQAGAPTPRLAELTARLRIAGIDARLEGDRLLFRFVPPEEGVLRFARAVPHPWLHEHRLDAIGVREASAPSDAVVRANAKLERMLASRAPDSLVRQATQHLENAVRHFLDALMNPDLLQFASEPLFSARTVLTPSGELRLDQLGMPDEIAWVLFGPLVVRETGNPEDPRNCNPKAAKALDAIMAASWVVLECWPAIMPTSFLAFHPIRHPDRVFRFPVLATALMNADFDGDQAAVFLPLTEGGQRDAAGHLSIAGHLRRDPTLIKWLTPEQDMVWGLATLSLTPEGRKEIGTIAGIEVAAPQGFVTRRDLQEAMAALLKRDGVERTLEALERLKRRAYQVIQETGASISPFFGASLTRPPEPGTDDSDAWIAYAEEIEEQIASRTDFDSQDLGPQLLAVKSGARGMLRHLARLCGPRGIVPDVTGKSVVVRHGFSSGYTPAEAFACAVPAREGLAQVAIDTTRAAYGISQPRLSGGFNVLARAMRATRPGIVFARAAATGEIDPLTDLDSRLFAGLPPQGNLAGRVG